MPAVVLLALGTLLRAPPKLASGPAPIAGVPGDETLPKHCASLSSALAPAPGSAEREQWAARSALYAHIAADFATAGFGGVSPTGGTQGMSVDELFVWDAATDLPAPRLTRLAVPVRAVVLLLPPASGAAAALATATRDALLSLCDASGLWLQDPSAYHMSLFHASHHMDAVRATPSQVEEEAAATAGVLNGTCPIHVVLERVTVTRGGVFIACWNVIGGGQPSALRAQLRAALPRAPAKQLVNDAPILHATLARVLRPPRAPTGEARLSGAAARAALAAAAARLSERLCGLRAVLDGAWFVLEHDALALALQGAYEPKHLPLSCAPGVEPQPLRVGGGGGASGASPPPALGGRALDQQR